MKWRYFVVDRGVNATRVTEEGDGVTTSASLNVAALLALNQGYDAQLVSTADNKAASLQVPMIFDPATRIASVNLHAFRDGDDVYVTDEHGEFIFAMSQIGFAPKVSAGNYAAFQFSVEAT